MVKVWSTDDTWCMVLKVEHYLVGRESGNTPFKRHPSLERDPCAMPSSPWRCLQPKSLSSLSRDPLRSIRSIHAFLFLLLARPHLFLFKIPIAVFHSALIIFNWRPLIIVYCSQSFLTGRIRPPSVYFLSFNNSITNVILSSYYINLKKQRRCAWDSNLGWYPLSYDGLMCVIDPTSVLQS